MVGSGAVATTWMLTQGHSRPVPARRGLTSATAGEMPATRMDDALSLRPRLHCPHTANRCKNSSLTQALLQCPGSEGLC